MMKKIIQNKSLKSYTVKKITNFSQQGQLQLLYTTMKCGGISNQHICNR